MSILISDATEATEFFKSLHDINQDFKKTPDLEVYFLNKDGVIALSESSPYQSIGSYDDKNKRFKAFKNKIEEYEGEYFPIIPQELFEFNKKYVKSIVSLEISDGRLEVKTNVPGVSLILDSNDYKNQLNKSKGIFRTINEIVESSNMVAHIPVISHEMRQFMESIRSTFNLHFSEDSITVDSNPLCMTIKDGDLILNDNSYIINSDVSFKFSYKYLFSTLKTSNCECKLYKNEEGYYIIKFTVNNKKFTVDQYFKIIPFTEGE